VNGFNILCRIKVQLLTASSTERFILKNQPDIVINYNSIKYYINILKPTGHVMHHQFNIQQLYALPTLYLCVLYLSVNKQ
jgi:hypothetical protein